MYIANIKTSQFEIQNFIQNTKSSTSNNVNVYKAQLKISLHYNLLSTFLKAEKYWVNSSEMKRPRVIS